MKNSQYKYKSYSLTKYAFSNKISENFYFKCFFHFHESIIDTDDHFYGQLKYFQVKFGLILINIISSSLVNLIIRKDWKLYL